MTSRIDLKFGSRVPDGAVNLAWISVPQVSPEDNVFVADLANTIPANSASYANEALPSNVASYSRSLVAANGSIVSTHSVTSNLVGHYSSPIRVLAPIVDNTDAWYVRLTDGVIRQNITVRSEDKGWLPKAFLPGTEVVAIYTLVDMELVPHNAQGDYSIYVNDEVAFPTGTHTIQLAHRDIQAVDSLTINGANIAISNNPNVSIDNLEGKITLTQGVAVTDEISVDYWYRTSEMIYYGFYDTDNKYKDLNLNPAYGQTYNLGEASAMLIGRVVSLFLLPAAAYDARAAANGQFNIKRAQDYGCKQLLRWTSAVLTSVPDAPGTIDDGEHTMVPRGTYGSAIYGTDHFSATTPEADVGGDNYSERNGSVGDIADFPSAVVLARLYVASTGTVDAVKLVDTRRRGGGLSDDPVVRQQMLSGEQLLEAGTCWDISGWDGEPAMLNGTTIVELPASILKSDDNPSGKFTQTQIEEIVAKRIPVGVMPVIRYIQGT